MSVLLVGYRGSGKSTVGRRLADKLWLPFLDTDDLVVKRAAKSIKDIFAQDGEPAFRDIEAAVVAEVCALNDHVIALGGGAVLREDNRAKIKGGGHKVIYMRCEPAVLYERIAADPTTGASRPNLTAAGGLDEVTQL